MSIKRRKGDHDNDHSLAEESGSFMDYMPTHRKANNLNMVAFNGEEDQN